MARGRLSSVPAADEPPRQGDDGGGGSDGIAARVRALETHLPYLATREDVLRLKIWVLGGVIGGMVIVAMLALAVYRLFLGDFGPSTSP